MVCCVSATDFEHFVAQALIRSPLYLLSVLVYLLYSRYRIGMVMMDMRRIDG
jgi:hypothetical protein